ncbi:MAG: TonB-dependent receptor [Bacillota bacterium]
MKRNRRNNIIILIVAALLILTLPAMALGESTPESTEAESSQDSPSADQETAPEEVVVTALRVESKDILTPAYVDSYTQEELKDTGATNVMDALQFTEGIAYNSMCPGGQSWGTMTSKAVIRGAERGTLVLVDGVKMNMNSYYNLEDISLENVERVEVVKGAASVLYGSEAFGGVINIITKKRVNNRVTLSGGSYGQINHSLSLQKGNFSITGVLQKIDTVKNLSDNGMGLGDSDKKSFQWSYRFNDQLTLTHSHVENKYLINKYASSGDSYDWDTKSLQYQYDDTKDYLRLCYQGVQWKFNVYGNWQDRDYDKDTGLNTASPTHYAKENYQFSEYGIDSQTTWDTSFATFLGGFGYSRENYQDRDYIVKGSASDTLVDQSRNGCFLFLQGTKTFGELTTVILGARQEYNDNGAKEDITAFCPQLQVLRALSVNRSYYINIGKSFKMPSLKQLYDETGELAGANADLESEDGWNYETGFKWKGGDRSLKLAAFHMDYDSITYVNVNKGTSLDAYYLPQNIPFRNTGIELSYSRQWNPAFSYIVGISLGNPEQRTDGVWEDVYGKVQLNTTLKYKYKQWAANLNANYFTDRAYTEKPQLPVNLTAAYTIGQNNTVNLAVTNLLDRRDINTHGSTYYYALPRATTLSYTHRF